MDQRPAAVARPGMDYQAGRLVDDEKVLIFEHNLQVHCFPNELAWHNRWQLPPKPVSLAKPASGPGRPIVVPYVTVRDQALNSTAAQLRQATYQVLIEPRAVLMNDVARGSQVRRGFRFARTVPITRTATPTVTAESATLKTGHRGTWMKSITEPLTARS